jgi:hypothetical protein
MKEAALHRQIAGKLESNPVVSDAQKLNIVSGSYQSNTTIR